MIPELNADAKALVREGHHALRPTLHDKARIFAALELRLALAGSSDPIASAGSLSASVLGKTVLGGMAFLIAVGAVALFLQHPVDLHSPTVGTVSNFAVVEPEQSGVVGERPTPSAVVLEHAVVLERAVVLEHSGAPPKRGAKAMSRRTTPADDKLGQEAALLMLAEKEYHAGHLANALAKVDEHARKFPTGVLEPERLKLGAHVLCGLALGQNGESAQGKPAVVAPCER